MANEKINEFPWGTPADDSLVSFGEPVTGWMYRMTWAQFKAAINTAAAAPPRVSAGDNQVITFPTTSVTLIGSATPIAGRTIVSYLWSKTFGPDASTFTSASNFQTIVTGLVSGTYVFRLTVTDSAGTSASADVSVIVNAQVAVAPAPIVNAGSNKTIQLPINYTTLNGTATAPGGSIVDLQWTILSGPGFATVASPSTAVTDITGMIEGVYVFRLSATSSNGKFGYADVTVTVLASGAIMSPNANAGANQTITLPTNTVSLAGTGTAFGGATITGYSWSKTAGPASGTIVSPAGATTVVNNLVAGLYTFRLTVTDSNGNTSQATTYVTVNPAPTTFDTTFVFDTSVDASGQGISATAAATGSQLFKFNSINPHSGTGISMNIFASTLALVVTFPPAYLNTIYEYDAGGIVYQGTFVSGDSHPSIITP